MFGKSQHHELQLERIVFFSDAVFAIAITLLIIEVKVPHLDHAATNGEFGIALLKLLPNLIGYFFSFLVIGAYWVAHHRIYGMIVDWNYGLVWRNIWFLLWIAFMPFATAFFSEYVTSFVPMLVYGLTFSSAGIMQIVQFRYAFKSGLLDPNVGVVNIKYITWRMTILPAAGVLAVAIAAVAPFFAGFAFMTIPIAHKIISKKFAAATALDEKASQKNDE